MVKSEAFSTVPIIVHVLCRLAYCGLPKTSSHFSGPLIKCHRQLRYSIVASLLAVNKHFDSQMSGFDDNFISDIYM